MQETEYINVYGARVHNLKDNDAEIPRNLSLIHISHAGAENIGASVIPMSSGNTEKQITLMHDFGSTVLCCTPSYALYLEMCIRDRGMLC